MNTLRDGSNPVAIYRNGQSIARVMRNGAEVWSAGGDWAWFDDFSTVDPRWVGGTFTPPGVSNSVLTGPTVPVEFELHYSVTMGSGTGGFGALIIDNASQPSGFVIEPNGNLTPYALGGPGAPTSIPLGSTSNVVLKRQGGEFSITIDGVLRGTVVDLVTREAYIYLFTSGPVVAHSLGVLGDGWGWEPWTAGGNVAQFQPAGSNNYTNHASFVSPEDMVLDLATAVTWRGSYASQRVAIAIDSWWVANIQPGTQSMGVQQRAFVPEGSLVEYMTANNTTASARWIDGGNWSARESQYGPQMTGPLVQYQLAANVWARAMTWRAHKDMEVQASISGFSWAQATSTSDRFIRVCHNGWAMAQSADEGTSVSATFTVQKGDEISFEARSESGTASFRDITAGTWSVSKV
ncbi:MAG: hypothetical protein ACK4UY_03805 [Dietzia sp.]